MDSISHLIFGVLFTAGLFITLFLNHLLNKRNNREEDIEKITILPYFIFALIYLIWNLKYDGSGLNFYIYGLFLWLLFSPLLYGLLRIANDKDQDKWYRKKSVAKMTTKIDQKGFFLLLWFIYPLIVISIEFIIGISIIFKGFLTIFSLIITVIGIFLISKFYDIYFD